jgi:AraC family transcriptional regulator, regulatory protein of adaptative response / methylated-DNA-[protein]-cysteine methyltransferase
VRDGAYVASSTLSPIAVREKELTVPVRPPAPHRQPSLDERTFPAPEILFATTDSTLGIILVAQSADGICAVLMGDDRAELERDLQRRFPEARLVSADATLADLAAKVTVFVESPGSALDLRLDLRGTEFQRLVWQALRDIPVGATASYTDVAERIGRPSAVRAVAAACAANALAVVVPCHRVVTRDGKLSSYRWGVARKRALLATEASRRLG